MVKNQWLTLVEWLLVSGQVSGQMSERRRNALHATRCAADDTIPQMLQQATEYQAPSLLMNVVMAIIADYSHTILNYEAQPQAT